MDREGGKGIDRRHSARKIASFRIVKSLSCALGNACIRRKSPEAAVAIGICGVEILDLQSASELGEGRRWSLALTVPTPTLTAPDTALSKDATAVDAVAYLELDDVLKSIYARSGKRKILRVFFVRG